MSLQLVDRPLQEERRLLMLELETIFELEPLDPKSLDPKSLVDPERRNLIGNELLVVVIWSPKAYFIAGSAALGPQRREYLNFTVGFESFSPGVPPSSLSSLSANLGNISHAGITGGPTYTIPPNITHPLPPNDLDQNIQIISSAEDVVIDLIRPASWESQEWDELLGGQKGPWALAVYHFINESGAVSNSVVATCFSARRLPHAAEAGVWTHPDFRGRRIAPSVVAVWANIEQLDGKDLFYSTSSDNLASQAVARQLGMQPLGWIWKLHRAIPVKDGGPKKRVKTSHTSAE